MTIDFEYPETSQDWLDDNGFSWSNLQQEDRQIQALSNNQEQQQQQQQFLHEPPLTLHSDHDHHEYPSFPQRFQASSQRTSNRLLYNKLSSCGESTTATSSTSESSSLSSRLPTTAYHASREDEWLDSNTDFLDVNNINNTNPPLVWDTIDTNEKLFDSPTKDNGATENSNIAKKTFSKAEYDVSTLSNAKKLKMNSTKTSSMCFLDLEAVDDLENLVVAQQESLMTSTTTCHQSVSSNAENKEEGKPNNEELSDLTQALNQMTLQEREKALFDVHGVSGHLPEKDEAQVAQWLAQMDNLIPQHAKDHPGLAEAIQKDSKFVRKERMKFLRSDEYDPVKAAERMGFYFDMKKEYFSHDGNECLCIARDLTVNDLTDDDIRYWRTGFYQISREKDVSGRIVCIVFLPTCYQLKIPVETMARVYMVMNTILTQNVDVQRTGNVHIAYANGLGEESTKFIGSEHFTNSVVKAGRWSPLRGVAKHFCYDHESLHPMFAKYAKPMATFNAVRFRSHFGTNAEVMFNLMSFGISSNSLPVSADGVVDTGFHNDFIDALLQQQQRRDERQRTVLENRIRQAQMLEPTPILEPEKSMELNFVTSTPDTPQHVTRVDSSVSLEDVDVFNDADIVPQAYFNDAGVSDGSASSAQYRGDFVIALGQMDVMLGRGTYTKSNPGNLKLKLLLEKYSEEYNSPSLNRAQKTAIVNSILQEMQNAGSRFVYPVNDDVALAVEENASGNACGGWLLASEERARDKITHDFRNLRRMEANGNNHALANESPLRSCAGGDDDKLSPLLLIPSSIDSLNQERSIESVALNVSNDADYEIIFCPSEMDVLLGRNKRKGNIGNKMLKEVLEQHFYEYEVANKSKGVTANAEKMVVVQKVLTRMDALGVRFLVQHDGGHWSQAPPEKVYDKMTQDFRNLRWAKKKRNRQMDDSA